MVVEAVGIASRNFGLTRRMQATEPEMSFRQNLSAKVARKVKRKFSRVAIEDHRLQFMVKN
jgi:hypothetical protein